MKAQTVNMNLEQWNKAVDAWVESENMRAGRVYKPSVGMYPPKQEGYCPRGRN